MKISVCDDRECGLCLACWHRELQAERVKLVAELEMERFKLKEALKENKREQV